MLLARRPCKCTSDASFYRRAWVVALTFFVIVTIVSCLCSSGPSQERRKKNTKTLFPQTGKGNHTRKTKNKEKKKPTKKQKKTKHTTTRMTKRRKKPKQQNNKKVFHYPEASFTPYKPLPPHASLPSHHVSTSPGSSCDAHAKIPSHTHTYTHTHTHTHTHPPRPGVD